MKTCVRMNMIFPCIHIHTRTRIYVPIGRISTLHLTFFYKQVNYQPKLIFPNYFGMIQRMITGPIQYSTVTNNIGNVDFALLLSVSDVSYTHTHKTACMTSHRNSEP